MPIRAALVGCGAISAYHLAGWRRLPGVEIAALADVDRERAERRRQAYAPAARTYASIEALLATETIDLLDIVTPPESHAALCLAAARAGVHIVCQKPLCATLGDARRLVDALRGYGRLFAVHENHPYRPWFRRVHEAVDQAALGPLRYVGLEQHDPYEPPETFKREAPRGVLLEYGVHLLAMLRALAGDPRQVYATCHHVNRRVRGESLAHLTLQYEAMTATVDISWKDGGAQQGGALFVGDAGEAFYEGRMTRGESARLRILPRGRAPLDEPVDPTAEYAEAFYLLERDVVEAIERGRPFTQDAAAHLRTLAVAFAAYASAEEGRAVDVGPWIEGT